MTDIEEKVELITTYIINLFLHAPIKRINRPCASSLSPNLRLIFKERENALDTFKKLSNYNCENYQNLQNITKTTLNREEAAYSHFLKNVCREY